MKIGIAGPISLRMLSGYVAEGNSLPNGYSFPPIAILAQELLRRGHQISVFALDPSTTAPKTFHGDRMTIHVGVYRAHHRARDLFATERMQLLEAMRSDPCDVIHAQWTYEFALAAIASGQPHLVTAHDAPWQVLRLYRNPYRAARLVMAYQVAVRARHMTAVSPYLVGHWTRWMRYRRQMQVVPNAIPEWLFRLGDRRQRSCGATHTFATVLNGWGGLKNGQVALQAFQAVRSALPEAKLLMFGIGHGPLEEGAEWAKEHGLTEGVEFVGSLLYDDLLKRLVDDVDILVHPAVEESFCMAIAEAMALGIPVIGGLNSGAVASTMGNGLAGLLVDVRSVRDMTQAMRRLALDVPSRIQFAQQGRESARKRFHIDTVLDSYEELYERIASRKGH